MKELIMRSRAVAFLAVCLLMLGAFVAIRVL